MTQLLEIVGSNVIVAGALAAVALCVTRCAKRPAIAHLLWVLVLVKLITPPLVRLPVGAPEPVTLSVTAGTIEPTPVAARIALPAVAIPESTPIPSAAKRAAPVEVAAPAAPAAPVDWRVGALLLWALGSAFVAGLTIVRLARFRRILRRSPSAPARVLGRGAVIGDRLGVRALPRILVVDARIAPMLWAIGRASIVLPRSLIDTFDDDELDAVIAHELAHLRRGDHWVRVLEMVCVVAFWWLPLTWWARRSLRRTEEECCDAWVVWSQPADAQVYARTLVKTLAFLSGDRLPAAACGVRHLGPMKRRLSMILERTPPRRLTTIGRVGAFVFAASVMTFVPTIAQDENAEERDRIVKQIRHVDRAMHELELAELPYALNALRKTRTRLVDRARSLGVRVVRDTFRKAKDADTIVAVDRKRVTDLTRAKADLERMGAARGELRTRIADLKAAHAWLRRNRTQDHPEIRERIAEIDALKAELNTVSAQLAAVERNLAGRPNDARGEWLGSVTTDFTRVGVDVRNRVNENQATIRRLSEMVERVFKQNQRLEQRLESLQGSLKGAKPRKAAGRVSSGGWHAAAADRLADMRVKQESLHNFARQLMGRSFEAEKLGKVDEYKGLQRKARAVREEAASLEKKMYELRVEQANRAKGNLSK